MSFRRLSAIARLTLVASAAALAGCGGSESGPPSTIAPASTAGAAQTAAPAPARKRTHGYPNSITVLGHSGSTGANSDPDQPGVQVRGNSWATGTNPAVDSLYLRILEHNPAIEGHNIPYSEDGATVDDLALQASRLLETDPKPDLIVVQIMDNDLICPTDSSALSGFRSSLTFTLTKLARGAPNSSQFVVSQTGSVPTYARSLSRYERASQGGTGPCDFMTPNGKLAPSKVARAEQAIHAYEAALKAACKTVRQCTYDGGAFGRIVDRRKYVSSDLNHLSISGHAKVAAVAWAALRRTHVLPRTR